MATEWKPTDPLPDKDREEEVQSEAQARARLKVLVEQYSTPPKKKKRSVFGRDED